MKIIKTYNPVSRLYELEKSKPKHKLSITTQLLLLEVQLLELKVAILEQSK